MGSLRTRLVVLAAVCVLAIGGAIAYLVGSRNHQRAAEQHAIPVALTSVAAVERGPRIVFRNTALGSRTEW